MSSLTLIKMYSLHLVFFVMAWQKVVLRVFHPPTDKKLQKTRRRENKKWMEMSAVCTVACIMDCKCIFKWREGWRLVHCSAVRLFRLRLVSDRHCGSNLMHKASRVSIQSSFRATSVLLLIHSHLHAHTWKQTAPSPASSRPDHSWHPEREISEKTRWEVRGWIRRSYGDLWQGI